MDTSKPIQPWDIVKATQSEISDLTTRHIHAMFVCWRTVGLSRREWEDRDDAVDMYEKATAILKAELSRRPHVPNKKEAKAIRQAAAKAGR